MVVSDIESIQKAETLLSESFIKDILEERDAFLLEQLKMAYEDKAAELKCKDKADRLMKAAIKRKNQAIKEENERRQRESKSGAMACNMTDFGYKDTGTELNCGKWTANGSGVTIFDTVNCVERIACPHPILITKILTNVETGDEKVRLAYQRNGAWKTLVCDKNKIASANKIVDLANKGILVTSETAKYLVKYLSELEYLNMGTIDEGKSTGKFGWIGKEFMPYDTGIEFDAEQKFPELIKAIQPSGSVDKWFDLVKEIRQKGRIETQIYLAASFSSILLKPLNALPFIVNLWGESGKGKTVALMLAASVWADPSENRYITDPKSSQTALEVRENLLNHLPMMIDDFSQLKEKYKDQFTDYVYTLCSGNGKDRSNVNLGLNNGTTWQNICLTNIERPLTTDTMRGGAINRILDFEMEEGYIFENGNRVVSILSKNYGFAGQLFVDVVKAMGFDKVREIQEGYVKQINEIAARKGQEKEEKQVIPLSILLTGDKIVTDIMFQDGIYLDVEKCVDVLKNRGEVSENERAYDFIFDEIAKNRSRFDTSADNKGEMWGEIDEDEGYVYIISNAFDGICERGNFSRKAFMIWAMNKGLAKQQGDKARSTILKKFFGVVTRCVAIKISDTQNEENEKVTENGQGNRGGNREEIFVKVPETLENTLPFD